MCSWSHNKLAMKTRLWFSSSCSGCSGPCIVFITSILLSFLGYPLELEQKGSKGNILG